MFQFSLDDVYSIFQSHSLVITILLFAFGFLAGCFVSKIFYIKRKDELSAKEESLKVKEASLNEKLNSIDTIVSENECLKSEIQTMKSSIMIANRERKPILTDSSDVHKL